MVCVTGKWVPHLLNETQKENRLNGCKVLRKELSRLDMMEHLVVVDEKWVYNRPVGKKMTNKCWVTPDGDRPQIPKRMTVEQKRMIVCAATFSGHFHVDVLPRGCSVNGEYYVGFLKRTMRKFSRRTTNPIEWNNLVLMHDNARPHVASSVKVFLDLKGVKMLQQPPYSPDLNFCDRFLFRNFEQFRSDIHFESDEALVSCVTKHFLSHSHDLLLHEYEKLKTHVLAVINAQGAYV
jgi:hypothetical protein